MANRKSPSSAGNRSTVAHVSLIATEAYLQKVRAIHRVLCYALMRLPSEDERIESPPPRWVNIYSQMFDNGVRLLPLIYLPGLSYVLPS